MSLLLEAVWQHAPQNPLDALRLLLLVVPYLRSCATRSPLLECWIFLRTAIAASTEADAPAAAASTTALPSVPTATESALHSTPMPTPAEDVLAEVRACFAEDIEARQVALELCARLLLEVFAPPVSMWQYVSLCSFSYRCDS
jgi:hypothetical protein